jgi:hypothetical protein
MHKRKANALIRHDPGKIGGGSATFAFVHVFDLCLLGFNVESLSQHPFRLNPQSCETAVLFASRDQPTKIEWATGVIVRAKAVKEQAGQIHKASAGLEVRNSPLQTVNATTKSLAPLRY